MNAGVVGALTAVDLAMDVDAGISLAEANEIPTFLVDASALCATVDVVTPVASVTLQ